MIEEKGIYLALDEQFLDNEEIELEIDEDDENEPEQNGIVEE
jgi:hypothetical protein